VWIYQLYQMKILDHIVRYIVGGLFIFSGVVKINDPVGMKIKLQEYFEVFAADFTSLFHILVPAAMVIGIFLIILEILLGIAVLINYRMNISVWILLVLIVFFTFLTFYSAYFNKVTDCGCFGDAIPLTPWESFYKDAILIVMIGYLFWRRNTYIPIINLRKGNIVIGAAAGIALFIGVYAIAHLPFIDFRAYKIGDNIAVNMQPEEDPIFEYTFRKDGEHVSSEKYLLAEDGFEYVDYKIKNPGKALPKITDYNVWNDDEGDYTEQSLTGLKLLLIIQEVDNSDVDEMEEINNLVEGIVGKVEVMVLTASAAASFENFRHLYQLAVPYYFTDATVLKAMIRSDPGIMLLRDGTVLGKWHNNDVPDAEKILRLIGPG